MKKNLPICESPALTMECWTSYKLAIIQTLPNHMNWLASHLNIYWATMGEKLYFGTGPKPHNMEYYSDILTIQEMDLYSIKPSDIVKHIKSCINNDFYYVVFLRNENGQVHDNLLYGYDDSANAFDAFALSENGRFNRKTITYEELYNGYHNNYVYYEENTANYYERHDFGYVMYVMKPNSKYIEKNYAAEYFDKLYYEVYGTKTELHYSDNFNEFLTPCYFYTGVTCLIKVAETLKELPNISHEETKRTEQFIIKKNLFKLLEHRKLIYSSMKWHEHQWNISDANIIGLHDEYHTCCVGMEKICMLYLKYLFTKKDSILEKIQISIEAQYSKERKILCEYVTVVRNYFTSKVLPQRFQ